MVPWGFNKLMRRSKRVLLDIGRQCHGMMFIVNGQKIHGKVAGTVAFLITKNDIDPLNRISAIKHFFDAFKSATSKRNDTATLTLLSRVYSLERELNEMSVKVVAKKKKAKKKKPSKKKPIRRRT